MKSDLIESYLKNVKLKWLKGMKINNLLMSFQEKNLVFLSKYMLHMVFLFVDFIF